MGELLGAIALGFCKPGRGALWPWLLSDQHLAPLRLCTGRPALVALHMQRRAPSLHISLTEMVFKWSELPHSASHPSTVDTMNFTRNQLVAIEVALGLS